MFEEGDEDVENFVNIDYRIVDGFGFDGFGRDEYFYSDSKM